MHRARLGPGSYYLDKSPTQTKALLPRQKPYYLDESPTTQTKVLLPRKSPTTQKKVLLPRKRSYYLDYLHDTHLYEIVSMLTIWRDQPAKKMLLSDVQHACPIRIGQPAKINVIIRCPACMLTTGIDQPANINTFYYIPYYINPYIPINPYRAWIH